jgi:hypothetical protein
VERKKNDAKKLSCEKLPQRLCYMSTMVEFVAWWASIAQRTPAWLVKANTHHHRGQSERACWQQQSVTTPKYTLMNHAYSFLNSTNKTLCDEEYASSIGYSHIMVCLSWENPTLWISQAEPVPGYTLSENNPTASSCTNSLLFLLTLSKDLQGSCYCFTGQGYR